MNNEFVSVRRDQLEAAWQALDDDGRYEESCPIRELLDNPAEQNQGEPVALPEHTTDTASCSALTKRIGLYGSVNVWRAGEIWNACIDEMAKLGPLYTHAATGEVERLRAEVEDLKGKLAWSAGARMGIEEANDGWREACDTLRAQLAELTVLSTALAKDYRAGADSGDWGSWSGDDVPELVALEKFLSGENQING